MRAAIAAIALIVLCTLGVAAVTVNDVMLKLPRALRPGDQLNVAVSVGPIGRNRIEVTTAEGQHLGTISLFGVPPGRAGGTYLIPVPPRRCATSSWTCALRSPPGANTAARRPKR